MLHAWTGIAATPAHHMQFLFKKATPQQEAAPASLPAWTAPYLAIVPCWRYDRTGAVAAASTAIKAAGMSLAG
jgi:hypothetical protein